MLALNSKTFFNVGKLVTIHFHCIEKSSTNMSFKEERKTMVWSNIRVNKWLNEPFLQIFCVQILKQVLVTSYEHIGVVLTNTKALGGNKPLHYQNLSVLWTAADLCLKPSHCHFSGAPLPWSKTWNERAVKLGMRGCLEEKGDKRHYRETHTSDSSVDVWVCVCACVFEGWKCKGSAVTA